MTGNALIICVNYFGDEDTRSYVESCLLLNASQRVDIVIVDNSERHSVSQVLKNLEKQSPRVKVAVPEKNLGFYNGAAWALREYCAANDLPEWVIVSNTDLFFEDKDFFVKLFSLYKGISVGIVAPTIISTLTGVDQNPQISVRPSARKMWFYTFIYRFYILGQAYWFLSMFKNMFKSRMVLSKGGRFKRECSVVSEIYAPHGSFVILNRNFFDKNGTLQHGSFLFGETITLAEHAIRLGVKVLYDPRLKVFHKEHASFGLLRSRQSIKFQWEGSKFTFETYFKK